MPSARPLALPVRGGDLAVDLSGPPPSSSEAVVVLVHDLAATATAWSLVTTRLPFVAAIAVDLRGRGGSADLPGPYGLRVHIEDLVAAMDALGVDRAVFVGHGAGAVVARLLADRYPGRVRAVVLVDGGAGPVSALSAAWRAGSPRSLDHRLADGAVAADAAELADGSGPAGPAQSLDMPAELLRAQWGAGDSDLALLDAAGDVELRRRFVRLRVVTVPGVDHETIVTRPEGADAVAAAIGRAIRAAPAGP